MTNYYRTCNLCEAMCGIEVQVEDGRVTSIRGDKDDPFSRGHICPKAVALQDIQNDPNRLRHPVKRVGNKWQQIGWEEAFETVVERIIDIQKRHGRNSVAIYQGNPTVHNYGSMLFAPNFVRALRTRNKYSATSVDQLPHMLASYLMLGNQLLLPVPDIDRTEYFLVMGANPVVSNGSLMTAPGAAQRIKEIRKRGGSVVVVDPRRTETAELADRHYFIRPGTDVYLLLGVLHTLFERDLLRPGRLQQMITSTKAIERLVQDYSPQRVARVCGVDATEIERIAVEFASAKSAVCYGRMGLSTQEFGSLCQWLIYVLNILTGNFDREGGAMFTLPVVDIVGNAHRLGARGHFGKWKSRVRGLPEFGGELPVAALAEEILTEGEGQVRMLITSAGNPVLSTPNGTQLERALESLEFMASIDFYINETTRHAQIILPPTAALEHDNYDLIFHTLAVRNTTRYDRAVLQPARDTRHDWEIFYELQSRLEQRKDSLKLKLTRSLRRKLGPRGIIALMIRFGPYGAGLNPFSRGLTLRKVEQAEHGLDLGALKPCLPDRLSTRSGLIEMEPEPYLSDLPRLASRMRELEQRAEGLVLIGRRQLRGNNSWMHNYERLVKGRNSCTLLIHPEDAARHHITHGKTVEVSSRTGVVLVEACVSSEMMPGVVSIPHGWGHNRPGIVLDVAATHAGSSINDLTDELALDAISGNAAFSGIAVSVRAVHTN